MRRSGQGAKIPRRQQIAQRAVGLRHLCQHPRREGAIGVITQGFAHLVNHGDIQQHGQFLGSSRAVGAVIYPGVGDVAKPVPQRRFVRHVFRFRETRGESNR